MKAIAFISGNQNIKAFRHPGTCSGSNDDGEGSQNQVI